MSEVKKQFEELLEKMDLPRCRRISKAAFNKANEDEQKMCYEWLQTIYYGKYKELDRVVKCIPKERWEHYAAHKWHDMDEVKVRRKLEGELRELWEQTMPKLLIRKGKTNG